VTDSNTEESHVDIGHTASRSDTTDPSVTTPIALRVFPIYIAHTREVSRSETPQLPLHL